MTALQNSGGNAAPGVVRTLPQTPLPTSTDSQPGGLGAPIGAIFLDDDEIYREAVSTELDYLGFRVTSFASGEAMLAGLERASDAEVIVLDWRLKSGLGIDLLPRLHEMGVRLPVVFLTGMPAVAAEYAALDLGAVDFVDKARGTAILAKRLHLIVQAYRARPQSEPAFHVGSEPVQCGKLTLQPAIARAYWDGVDVELTLSEFKVVHLLVSRGNEYVTYRSIYDCVRYEGFVAGNGEDGFKTNVRSSIKRIRNKFRQLDDDFTGIENYPAFGYRWRRGVAAG